MTTDGNKTVWLDRTGHALPPGDCLVIKTEVEFLEHALDPGSVLIRGDMLCRWAEAFYRGRGIPCQLLRSPAEEILASCQGLSAEQATALMKELGALYEGLSRPIGILDILRALFANGPWQAETSRSHAAGWLLWLRETDIPEYIGPLLAAQRQQWLSICAEAERIAYGAANAEQAQEILACWLGLGDEKTLIELGAFPVPIPETWIDRLREDWASEIIRRGCEVLAELRGRGLPRQLLEEAAAETAKYCQHHPERLTQEDIGLLSEYLSAGQLQRLRALLPPKVPGSCPESTEGVLRWFVEQYLPYRDWECEHGDDNAHKLAAAAARSFAEWYLDYYPTALSGGEGRAVLAISQSSKLHTTVSNDVILWVIADGLHYLDAEELIRLIERQCSRLSLVERQPVFSTIPTVTEYAKPALLQGLPPVQACADNGMRLPSSWTVLSESKDPSEQIRGAQPSDVFVWSLQEPDRSYHKRNDRQTIRKNVDGQLQVLASKIADAVQAVPDGIALRVVISTDHGRLLGGATRQSDVPDGMIAHGRAAWGQSGVSFPDSGVVFQEDIAYLRGPRFGLAEDCAVVIGDGVFKTSDGKGGQEEFPHGGLYPEEVIIAWIDMARDRLLPKVKCHINGRARAGSTGIVTVLVENLGDVPVDLVSLNLDVGPSDSRMVRIHGVAAPYDPTELKAELENWPTAALASRTRATVCLRLPAGSEFECQAELLLQSDEMYSRDTLLEDL